MDRGHPVGTHDIPHPIGDPDEEGDLPGDDQDGDEGDDGEDDDEDDDEDEDPMQLDPMQVDPTPSAPRPDVVTAPQHTSDFSAIIKPLRRSASFY